MEAFAAVEGVLARRRRFSTLLDRRMRKLQTELLFPQAKAVLAQLETARFLNDRLIDEIRQRLFDAIESLLPHAIVIDEPPDLIVKSIRERLIPQPTDNLILHTILHHAATHPDVKKALLTANKKDFSREQPREAMKADAVALHGRYPAAIEWMTHACES